MGKERWPEVCRGQAEQKGLGRICAEGAKGRPPGTRTGKHRPSSATGGAFVRLGCPPKLACGDSGGRCACRNYTTLHPSPLSQHTCKHALRRQVRLALMAGCCCSHDEVLLRGFAAGTKSCVPSCLFIAAVRSTAASTIVYIHQTHAPGNMDCRTVRCPPYGVHSKLSTFVVMKFFLTVNGIYNPSRYVGHSSSATSTPFRSLS